ncbi:MAG TPA: bifunctional diaminohydroxyphosphoribosylaminopyrimidine deaminase/5-amino-6-(5-phosphoribosylamino)uracil reductase RibD, partial [Coriobacteriia bacterium]|nr:bifunctional diaminohydroxyphosphoribosylaminopyrimidine deaminase/5-amino-6-(5-phosphoribosylamino)uracil reductase RibD [Coriobacteriia bacterium]
MTDSLYMKRAVELARKGSGWVNPNPQVGAVIVRDDRVIGEGYHERFGELHAERNALLSCTEPAAGATMYVTLEPCCHTGKTPPCTDAILEAGIAKVVAGSNDPNPSVAGKGFGRLREAGIEVVTGFMQNECDALNRIFFHYIRNKTPYVLMKYAMTLDGKIATRTGESKWITGEAARADVQRLRGRYAAIMVGIGTVLADDPLLTCRLEGERNPLRVVCDSRLAISLESQIVQTACEVPTLIATTTADSEKIRQLGKLGCSVLTLPAADGHVDLKQLLCELATRGVDSVLVEGGATLHGAL